MLVGQASSLLVLDRNLTDMIDTVERGDHGLATLDALIGEVTCALGYPGKLEKDLAALQKPLTTIQQLAANITILPAVGSAAGAVSRVLKPMVRTPPPGGLMGETRTVLKEIDTALKPIKTGFDKAAKPITKTQDAIGAMLARLRAYKQGVDYLIRIHGDNPPAGVEKCAARLNSIIAKVMAAFHEAFAAVAAMLDAYTGFARTLTGVLHMMDGFIQTVHNDVVLVTGGAMTALRSALDEINRQLARLKHLGEFLLRRALKALGVDLDSVINGLRTLEAKIDKLILGPIKAELTRAKDDIIGQIETIPAVEQFHKALETLEQDMESLRDSFENALGETCTDLLTPHGTVAAFAFVWPEEPAPAVRPDPACKPDKSVRCGKKKKRARKAR